jgi:hypothetical protein
MVRTREVHEAREKVQTEILAGRTEDKKPRGILGYGSRVWGWGCNHPALGRVRDSSVSIALGYGLDDRGSRVRFPAGAGNVSLHHRVQNCSLGVKRLGREADHSPPSSAEVKVWVELHLHSPNTPSGRGAQLKHRDNFTFTLPG